MNRAVQRPQDHEDVRLLAPPRMAVQTIAEMVKYHRTRAGLSQRDLAARAGTTKSSIYFLERGQNGTGQRFFGVQLYQGRSLVDRVAEALGIDEGEKLAAIAHSYRRIGYFLRKPSEQGKVLLFSPR